MGQRWFVDRHPPGHTYQSSEIFRDHRAARPDAEGWKPKHLTDRRQATKEGRRRIDPFQNLFVVLQDIAARPRRNKIKPRSTLVSTFGEHGIIAWEKPPLALQPTQTHIALSVSASRTVDGLILPHSHRLGPLATIDGGNLRFEIGDDVRREGADVQKDHYHHHDIFQSPRIGARAE